MVANEYLCLQEIKKLALWSSFLVIHCRNWLLYKFYDGLPKLKQIIPLWLNDITWMFNIFMIGEKLFGIPHCPHCPGSLAYWQVSRKYCGRLWSEKCFFFHFLLRNEVTNLAWKRGTGSLIDCFGKLVSMDQCTVENWKGFTYISYHILYLVSEKIC